MPRTLAAAAFAAVFLAAAPSAPAATSTTGVIVFTSTRDGTEQIYAANADGSNQRNLTQSPGANREPALSPDASRVAFVSTRNGRQDLFLMNADGSGQTQLTDGLDPSVDTQPSWSPDGTQLVFASTRPFNEAWHLWIVNADGTNLRQLTDGFGVAPAWSPDGATIAYDGGSAIWLIGADGSNAHALAIPLGGVGPMSAPAWSPDGTRLAFSVQAPAGAPSMATIFVAAADGSSPQQITDWGSFDSEPQWSPDGTTLMFQRFFGPGNPLELFSTTLDRRFLSGVVTAPGDNYQPSWRATAAPPAPPRDTIAPTITLNRPTADGTDRFDVYTVGQVVLADYSCSDEGGSGLRHCTGPVPSGQAIDTRFIGTYDFSVFAVDNAGNPTYKRTSYRVIYPFSGFFAPLQAGTTYDLRAGDSAPLKFSLGADYGLDAVTAATQQQTDCTSGAALSAPTAAGGTLTYNTSQGRYLYDWRSDKASAGTCRSVTLALRDGTSHRADFRLTR